MKKTNKLISILLVLAMLLSMAPISVFAAEATPTAEIGGKTYYELDSADDLDWFAAQVNGGNTTINATLTKDITYNSGTMSSSTTGARVWTPVGTYEMPFEGIINGNGYTISGLYCKDPEGSPNLALVSYSVKATIANVAVTNFYFESKHGLIAGLASYAAGSTIYNCYAQGSIYAKDAGAAAAGICAAVFGHSRTEILNCLSDVVLKVDDPSDFTVSGLSLRNYIGGIICTGDKNNPVLIQKTVYITDRYNGTVYDENNSLASHFEIYDSEGMPASKLATGEIAYILGKGWGQKLGTDSIPEIGNSNIVNYGYVSCDADAQKVYTNSATNPNYPEHYDSETDSDNACDFCGTNLHTHSFIYSASGDTITAVCENTDGNCPDSEGTLTILAPADLYVDGTTAKEATVENNLVDTSVAISDITYSAPYGLPPKDAGTYTASVTVGGATASVEFELIKRSAIAENFVYTAPENLVYDGTAKYATVEVSPEITGMGAITVTYNKDGEAVEPINAGTYTVKVSTAESDKYYAINDVELASFTIAAKDISDGFIILGDALTYNGTEQTQTVEKVIPTGTAPEATYTVSGNKATNVGVYLLTVTGTGNFTGEAKIAFEIAVDMNGVDFDQLHPLNVKATDREKIEYIYNQVDNAFRDYADEAKRNEWDNLKSTCVELLKMIESVENHIESFENDLAKYDINTVTSDDAAELERFQNSVGKFYNDYYDNLTDEQIKKVTDIYSAIEDLETRISDVAEEIARIESAMNIYDTETVKSSDEADIEKLKADIKALTDGQNITADERAKLENLDATADALLAKIAETKSEYDRVIAAANGYDEATVTSADKDALVQLNDDIYALALTDNVTAEEKENLQAAHNKVLALLDKITAISDEIKRIIEAVDKFVFESVKSSDKADIQQLIADIKILLDTQNITADERALLEGADETCDKLIAKIDETVAEINRINDATNAYDEATVTSADKDDIEKLLADIKALTDGDNITDAEREQLNGNEATLKALLDKIGATADEIERIETAVNGYDEESVKSTDKADLEQLIEDIKALTDTTNITEDERTKLGELDAKIDALIKKIDDTAAKIERIDEAVNGYDKETVTSDEVPELGKLIEDIKALTDGDNITEDEEAALEEIDKAIDELVEKLAEVAEEIKRVDEAVKSYDEETVKSTDKEDLEQLKEDIQDLIGSDNTTENEKTALEEMIKDIEGLEDKIEEIEQQLERIAGIENVYNPEKVTSDDKAAIEEAIAEIEAVNPDNLTDEQKAEYEEIKTGFEALLEEIAAAEKDVADIGVELEMLDEERVTKFREDDIETLKAKIDELIADENMGEAEKAKLNEYKAQAEKLIEIINTPKEYFSLRFFYLIWDCLTWKYNGILWFISKIFSC